MTPPPQGLWGGRFDSPMAAAMERLNRSLDDDFRLWPYDIVGSVAWAGALRHAGVLDEATALRIQSGLTRVGTKLDASAARDFADEDVHTLIERLLGEEIGPDAGRVHTGRSRNDQVSTDLRLWGKETIAGLSTEVRAFIEILADRAAEAEHLIMPGYTHLQPAQPIRWAHWLLSHAWPLVRDLERLRSAAVSADVLPLGSGAIAGCPFPVDRRALADELGFAAVTQNSLDATSDRDWAIELSFACALLGSHLSRLGEDLVLFSTREFGFVQLDDAYTTGSSLMPQKRNPDVAELARGAAALLVGDLTALLVLVKGLPTGYNRDLQHDKAALFRQTDLLGTVLPALRGAVATLKVDAKAMQRSLRSELLATDAADHLVDQGIAFRESHEIVGRLVKHAEAAGVELDALDPADIEQVHAALRGWRVDEGSYLRSADRRDSEGGTGATAVAAQIVELRRRIADG